MRFFFNIEGNKS